MCRNMKMEACYSVPGGNLSIGDYYERLHTHINLQIKSDHCRNSRLLYIEG